MAVTFTLESRKDKKGDAPIRVSIVIFGNRFQTLIGYSINPEKWTKKDQQVTHGCNNAKGITYSTINSRIKDIESKFANFENDNQKNKDSVSVSTLKNEFQNHFGKKKQEVAEKSFFDYFDQFKADEAKDKDWTVSTIAKFGVIKNHLKEFNENLTFENFDHKGLSEYRNFLLKKKEMRNTTIEKQMKFLKWFLRWSVKYAQNKNIDFVTFAPKKDKKKNSDKRVIFLEAEELKTVYNFPIPETKNYLIRVRDVFCFCCFTGLRHSDVYNLKRSDIKGDSIQFDSIKTGDKLTIELNKYSRAILDKYKDEPYEGNKALPVISNQKMNDYLKELGKLCKINEPTTEVYFKGDKRIEETKPKYDLLGTHTGRRTFICNALALGIPAIVVMKWTGHSDFKSMQPYVDAADKTKAVKMKMFDKL
jgi:integrase